MTNIYFVEFHYVKYNNIKLYNNNTTQYFINEICVLDKYYSADDQGILYFNTFRWPGLFLLPATRRTYEYNREKCHGIDLNKGSATRHDYAELWSILNSADVVLVRGDEKRKIISQNINNKNVKIMNVTRVVGDLYESSAENNNLPGYVPYDYLLDTYHEYDSYCLQHRFSNTLQRMCSLRKAMSLRQWFVENYLEDFTHRYMNSPTFKNKLG